MVHQASDLVGQTLSGRYRIDSELGEGGMGAVYLATDLELHGRRVVLKFPHAENLDDPAFRLRFRDEIGSLAKLDHPHILNIHDAGEHEGRPFAVVQFAGGGDLRDRIEEREQTPAEVLAWLPAIASALDFVSQSGFCHRDVKPANIFFDEAGHPILSDFGIATILQASPESGDVTFGDRTAIGMFVGSPKYCPPEALRRELSPAYDQYSLAVSVYQCLSGQLPVGGETSMDVLFAKNNEAPRNIRELVPALPERAAAAIMRALSRERSERFASCREFADEFAAGLGGAEGRSGSPSRADGLWWIGAAGLSLALVAGLWLVRGRVESSLPVSPRTPGPLVVTTLHQVELGSTPDEFRDAIGLCRLAVPDCDASWFASETERKTVLAPYALDLHEVSVEEFTEFVELAGYVTTAEQRGSGFHQFVEVEGLDWRHPAPGHGAAIPGLPVVQVSYFDAEAFCEQAGMRLPTEDEWEHAAKGDARRVFPWGDRWEPDRVVWGADDIGVVEVVDSRPEGESALGHRHLAGNVAEWTSTVSSGDRIIKGGSWQEMNPAQLRSAARAAESPEYASSEVGFRCVFDSPQPD